MKYGKILIARPTGDLMKEKAISKITYFISGLLFISVGLTIIYFRNKYINFFHLLSSILLIILGTITFNIEQISF